MAATCGQLEIKADIWTGYKDVNSCIQNICIYSPDFSIPVYCLSASNATGFLGCTAQCLGMLERKPMENEDALNKSS